jgi:hypothetical protein
MSRLHQIQIRYEALEDRALLRVATTDGREFRFWVTRRYARLLWQALSRSAARGTPGTSRADPVARQAVMGFQREAALAGADFSTRYREQPRETPLGDAPVLLARITCTPRADGTTTLAMHPMQGQGVEVRLDARLLHSLMKLLNDAATAGEWDLQMPMPDLTASASGTVN